MRSCYACIIILTTVLPLLPAVEPYRSPASVPDTGIGIHYDGSGVVPGAKPPLGFDQKSGTNIRWTVELPQWGMAGLVPVGNRVLHLADADARFIWPVLRCYDAKTGALAWERAIDPLDAFPDLAAEERERVTATMRKLWETNRAAFRAMRPVVAGTAQLAQANEELAAHGITIEKYKPGYGTLRYVKWPDGYEDKGGLHATYNIQPNLCNQGIARTGDAFATPVTDGELVYVTTIHGHVAAVKLTDGTVAWTRSLAEMEAPAYKERNHCMASPRLYRDILLAHWGDTNVAGDDVLVALDKTTGKELWHLTFKAWDNTLGGLWQADNKKAFRGRPGASPRILEIDDEAIALLGGGLFVRVRDGKPYQGGVLPNVQNYVIDHATNRIFGCVSLDGAGSHFGARVSLEDGALAFESLFFHPAAGVGGGWGGHGLWYDGRLLWKGTEFDPGTGLPLCFTEAPADAKAFKRAWGSLRKSRSPTVANNSGGGEFGFGMMFTALGNNHIYGMTKEKASRDKQAQFHGVLYITTLDGKRVSSSRLVQDEQTPEHLLDQGWPEKDAWSYTAPMALGEDCVYIASDQYLYCIGGR